MSYESDRSSAGVGIAIAVALVVVVLGGLLVLGAGVFWLRSSTMRQQELMVAREQALMAEDAMRQAEAQRNAADIPIETELPATSDMTIVLDADGNLQLNDVDVELEQLRQDLSDRMQNTELGSVIISAAAESKFEDVTRVLSLCMEMGVLNIQIRRSP